MCSCKSDAQLASCIVMQAVLVTLMDVGWRLLKIAVNSCGMHLARLSQC